MAHVRLQHPLSTGVLVDFSLGFRCFFTNGIGSFLMLIQRMVYYYLCFHLTSFVFFFCISNFYYFFSSFLVRLGVFFSISFAPVCCHDASLHDLLYLAVAIHYTLLSLLLAPAIRNIDAGVYPHFLSTISTVPYLAHCLELHFSYDIPTRSC